MEKEIKWMTYDCDLIVIIGKEERLNIKSSFAIDMDAVVSELKHEAAETSQCEVGNDALEDVFKKFMDNLGDYMESSLNVSHDFGLDADATAYVSGICGAVSYLFNGAEPAFCKELRAFLGLKD